MISLIAAIGKNNELGKNNKLIWHLPNDLKFFKEVTTGHVIVMGKNTFNSLPKVLPNRTNVVITSSNVFLEDVIVCKSIQEVLDKYNDFYVIGGASIYNQFIKYADKLYLTEINDTSDADVYFPLFDKSKYTKEIIGENIDNGIEYKHVLYRRKK